VLIAPVLAFALAATGFLALRCTVTGVVMADASCPLGAASETPERPAGHDAIRDPACCERLLIETGKIPVAGPEHPADLSLTAVAPASPSLSILQPLASRPRPFAFRVAEPRSLAAPRFLLSHSFLI
jgi:hypothetical protein